MQRQPCPDACIYSFFYMHKLVLIRHGEYHTPALEPTDPRCESGDVRYAKLTPEQVPPTEFLKYTVELNIPNGIPLVYELDNELIPIRHYYLEHAEATANAGAAVVVQEI